MILHLITANSVTFELENNDCYETNEYEIYLNNIFVRKNTTNVCSLYDLVPNKDYELKIKIDDKTEVVNFKTLNKKLILVKPSEQIDHTKELQEAIDNLNTDEVLVLDGIFHIVSLFLKDNTTIYLKKDSLLLGETDRKKFPILKHDEYLNGYPLGTWEGRADDSFASIITILGKKDIIIYGEGVIDCNASNSDWWINHRVMRIARRPKGLFIHSSKNVALEGITITNTPSWNQHPFYSENLKYLNLKLINPANSPTTDGIDPESSKNVEIIGTKISVGDDCIAIKSGKIELARKYKTPSSYITIRNCLMEYGHAGVTLGSENSGGINHVKVSKCKFNKTDRGLRIKSQRGRGNLAVIEDITFDNIIMDDVKSPFVINAFYKAGNDEVDDRFIRTYQEPSELTPVFKSFLFNNIKCFNISYGLGCFLGLPESPLSHVTLKNIDVTYKKDASAGEMAMTPFKEEYKNIGVVAENITRLTLDNVNFIDEPTEKFILKNVRNIEELN